MKSQFCGLALGLLSLAGVVGCHDNTPSPPQVAVPAPYSNGPITRSDDVKPMPPLPPSPGEVTNYPGPYNDEPLLVQHPPEQRAFVDAYHHVGNPRIVVFVNRTLSGQIVGVNDTRPLGEVERQPHAQQPYGNAPYDEASNKTLDYEAVENVLTDWIACNGQVTVVSPTLARARLTKEQVTKLEDGERLVLGEIAQRLDADIFLQVQAHPTRQTQYGMEVRLVAEAINVRGGQSLGRAVVDVPPPLDKNQINKYTRFLARKLMDDMTGAWLGAPPPPPRVQVQPAPTYPPPAASASGAVEVPAPSPAPVQPVQPAAPGR